MSKSLKNPQNSEEGFLAKKKEVKNMKHVHAGYRSVKISSNWNRDKKENIVSDSSRTELPMEPPKQKKNVNDNKILIKR